MNESISIEDALAGAPSPRFRWAYLTLGVLLVAVVAGAYWIKISPSPETTSQDALMKAGLDALYTRTDAVGAAASFRRVLELNPSHYGATFQLAMALDRAGKPAEARPYWEKMLTMAEAIPDEQTLTTVRERLKKVEPISEEAIQGAAMSAGLDALYQKGNPIAAAADFRKVLALNPTHYGATFQLAKALDRAGKPAEARPFWEKALKMAEGYDDKPTIDVARARLARTP